MRRNLRNMFHRMQLTEQDVRTLRGMIVRLVEGPRSNVRRRNDWQEGQTNSLPGPPAPVGPEDA